MSTPKKHHFLPQFYLEHFQIHPQKGKYPHIWRLEKSKSPNPTSPAIKDTGCRRDYHTINFEDQDRKTIEGLLSQIESEQAALVNSICRNNEIPNDKKGSLSEFVTAMRFRVPAFKNHIESSLRGVVLSIFKTLMHTGKLHKPPKELENLIQERGYDFSNVNIFNWKILQHMIELAFNSENAAIIEKMNFQLIFAPNDSYFVTCDSPVAIYHPDYESIKPYGVGPAFKDIEITFPISKSHMLKLIWNAQDGVIEAEKDDLKEYNRRTIVMANEQIFSSEVNPDLLEQIIRYHRIEAGYKLDDLWYGEGSAHIHRFIPVTK